MTLTSSMPSLLIWTKERMSIMNGIEKRNKNSRNNYMLKLQKQHSVKRLGLSLGAILQILTASVLKIMI
ncbi:unnamed protein product [Meloidogyne enterolobii]|uniref:Uncharacterized protein n=1 Tax=Meloidogyne enterolobii TaxID=390850 RepID=A0ACB0ZB69_MELEN